MYELLLGVAMGYIAFTEDGHKIGNNVADFAIRNCKPIIKKTIKNISQNKEDKNNIPKAINTTIEKLDEVNERIMKNIEDTKSE